MKLKIKSFRWIFGITISIYFIYTPNTQATESPPSRSTIEIKKMIHSQENQGVQSASPSSVINFDVNTLKSLGYGAEIADFFKYGSQYLPGEYTATLVINKNRQYSTDISVGENGQLCMTPSLQQTLKLRAVRSQETCPEITQLYPGSQITAHPENTSFDILLAETAFDPQLRGDELTYGGFALLNNYRIYGIQMSSFDRQHFYQGQFESGVNWQNWILRNNSSFSAGRNSSEYQLNETTLARSIPSLHAQLQLGQINSQGILFGGTPLNGVQLYSDSDLQNTSQLLIPITGVAQTAATVEIMQNGRLLYRTLVPAGPFELNRINGIVSGQLLQVSVIQEDGQRQQFNMVASHISDSQQLGTPLYQLAIGKYRKRPGNHITEPPLVLNMEGSLRYQATNYLAGFQFSERYQSVAGRIDHQWGEEKRVSGSLGSQYAHSSNKQGQLWDANVSIPLGPFSFGMASLYQSRDYPTLDETLQKETSTVINDEQNVYTWWRNSETKMANSASIGWGDAVWGRISYALGYTQYYGKRPGTVLHTVSYAKRIQNASLSASYQGGNDKDHRLFVNLSVPFGRNASLSTRIQRYQDETTLSTTFNHRPYETLNYSVGASHNNNTQRVNGSVNATTPYSQLAANGSWSDNTHSLMFSSSGSVVYADGLLATSPIALGDTFGVLRVPGQYGVQISTMGGGSTMTNHFGIAAIPTLPVNRKTTVQLNTRNLPLNIRLGSTSFDVAVARGTVISRDIPATVRTQLLLNITYSDGSPAQSGSSVIDDTGQLMGVVTGNGNVLLSNEQAGRSIRLRMANQTVCQLHYRVPKTFDSNLLYEEIDARCQ